jgi:hypothetical protein
VLFLFCAVLVLCLLCRLAMKRPAALEFPPSATPASITCEAVVKSATTAAVTGSGSALRT